MQIAAVSWLSGVTAGGGTKTILRHIHMILRGLATFGLMKVQLSCWKRVWTVAKTRLFPAAPISHTGISGLSMLGHLIRAQACEMQKFDICTRAEGPFRMSKTNSAMFLGSRPSSDFIFSSAAHVCGRGLISGTVFFKRWANFEM